MFDTMVFTKALGALCGALLIFLLGSWVSNSIFVPGSRNLPPAFVIDLGNGETEVAEAEDAPAELSIAEAFQMADADAGGRVWNQCRACHVADDTRNNVGPYLQNVVGRDIAAVDGFRYSGALPEDERWTVENLYAYLENPRGWAPGTSMAFNGLRSQMDRVNVIAFLIENSPNFDPATDAPAIDEAALEEDAPEADVAEVAREEEPAEEVAEAPAEDATEEEVTEAPAEEVREEDVAEAPEAATEEDLALAEDATEEEAAAPEAREEDAAEAPAEEATEEEVAEAPAEEAIEEEVAEAPAEEEAVAEDAAEMSEFAQMVAAGDVQAGSRVWNQCRACHVADAEQSRVGPHLVGIVGRQANSIDGFRYSGNLPDVTWTLDELNAYLENPRGYAPGTSMAFNGLRNIEDRANVLAYIESVQ